jgi:hypothetical protein
MKTNEELKQQILALLRAPCRPLDKVELARALGRKAACG